LDEAKNNMHRWLGCGYSEGYHAPKCCKPGGICTHGCPVPYTARYPRNPSWYTGRVNYPGACGCGVYGAYGPHAWSAQDEISETTIPQAEVIEPSDAKPIPPAPMPAAKP
jgi:hypothetical protein